MKTNYNVLFLQTLSYILSETITWEEFRGECSDDKFKINVKEEIFKQLQKFPMIVKDPRIEDIVEVICKLNSVSIKLSDRYNELPDYTNIDAPMILT